MPKFIEFQSTRPHGARRCARACARSPRGFNPRARTGRDRQRRSRTDAATLVSIHAPARGATAGWAVLKLIVRGFNPRARTGRDFGVVFC